MITSALLLSALAIAQGRAPVAADDDEVPAPVAVRIEPPELIADVAPVYPPDAFREGVTGPVTLAVELDDEGRVMWIGRAPTSTTDSNDSPAPPDPRLVDAALGALTNFEFLPAREVMNDGTDHAIPVRFTYTLTFVIDEVERERVLAEEEAARQILARQQAEADRDAQRAQAPENLIGRVRVAGRTGDVSGASVLVEAVTIDGVDVDPTLIADLEALTDEKGVFVLRGVPAGRVVLAIDAPGFEGGRVVIDDKKAAEVDEVTAYLVPKQRSSETVVRGRRTQREVTKRVLTQKELTRVPGTFGDAIRVVQRLPGVSRSPFGTGAVLVRGGSPEDSTVLIDGHLARYLFHLGAGPSVLNSEIVERLEFYPGGQGARFGRAIAGAIDVVTRDPDSDQWSGRLNIDLLATSFRLEGPLTEDGNVSAFFAARTSYVAEVLNAGALITEVLGDDTINVLTLAPRYADYQAKVLWKMPGLPGLRQSMTMSLFGAHDTLDLALDASQLGPQAPSNVGLTQGFHRLNPVYRVRSNTRNDAGEPILSAYVSPIGELTYSENRFDVSQFRLDIQRVGVRAEVSFRPTGDFGVSLGTDDSYALFTSTVDVPFFLPDERIFPRPATSDPPRFLAKDDVFGTSTSFYVDSDLTLGPITLLMGGRADLWTFYDQTRTSFDPRFAFRAQLLPFSVLKGNLGLYHQTPSPFFISESAGNPDLPLEQGIQTGLGLETWLTRSLDVDAQFFVRTATDLAEPVTGNPIGFVATGGPRIQAIGEERAYGAELLIRQRLDQGVFGWVSYTLMRSEEQQRKPDGIEGAEARGWRSTEFDQTHNFSVAVSAQLPPAIFGSGLEVGGAFRYVTGNVATLAQGGVFDADDGRFERVNQPSRSQRLPPFIQADVRIDKRFTFDTWNLGLYLDLQNATNQQNFEFFQYNYDFTEVQGFPGLPILPVFGAEASF